MFKNYLLVAWRNLLRSKKTSVINIAGLSSGITACLFIFMVLRYENSFDTFQPDYNRIYRVVTKTSYETGVQYNSGVSFPVADAMRTEFPQIEKISAFSALSEAQFSIKEGKEKYKEQKGIYFTEPAYFDMFHTKWLAGKPAVLSEPDVVVLDKTTAVKYFGTWQKALGQVIALNVKLPLKVAGVIEDAPANTDFPLRIILSYATFKQHGDQYGYQKNDWGGISGDHQLFVLLPQKLSAAQIDGQLQRFSKFHYQGQTISTRQLFLLPLKDNHFDVRFGYIVPHIVNRTTLQTLSFIGLLILMMAVINFINLTTAQTVERSKEIGIRKALGSRRLQLIYQLMTETFFIVAGAVILSMMLAELIYPFLREMANLPAGGSILSAENLRFMGIMTVLVTLLAGSYPSLVLSGLQPLAALKKRLTASGNVRRGLVITQFMISQVLIVATIVAISQMHLIRDVDLGFNKEAMLMLAAPANPDVFKTKLLQNTGVAAVTLANDAPASNSNWMDIFYYDHAINTYGFNVDIKTGDADYLKTFELQLLAGRNYYNGDNSSELVINETFAKGLGFRNPADAIGHTLKVGDYGSWRQVVGVVKDFVNNTLRDKIRPTAILPMKDGYFYTCVKLQPAHFMNTVNQIRKQWEELYPDYTYNGYFLDQNIATYYRQEQQLTGLYKLFAGIAIFISCLGLYGLVSFMTIQKRKEIGIRKILGASISHILFLFCKEFVILILIAFMIAAPLSWFAMNRWLENFTYHIHPGAAIFITALLMSVSIALITVGHKAAKAALRNPVRSLRMD
jgi:ABC-type antimicrobial peptide transport system permease subunit